MHVSYGYAALSGHAHQAGAYSHATAQGQINHVGVVKRLHANAGSIACVSAAAHSNYRIVQRCAYALLVIAGANISIGHGAAHGHRCTAASGKAQGASHSDNIRIVLSLYSDGVSVCNRVIDGS